MEADWVLGAAFAFVIAVVTTPAGVSGAVLLLPVQVSVLHVPNPAVTPTNLLYNVVATPGALLRFWREGSLSGPLVRTLVAGTLPGVIVGAVLRVEVLNGPDAFLAVIAVVLGPMGLWLLLGRRSAPRSKRLSQRGVSGLALGVGVVGGIYGIGGGSILAPCLTGLGWKVKEVAPAALASTFAASVVGVLTFEVLQAGRAGTVGPDWTLGLAMGTAGLLGSYVGARLSGRVPETMLRTLLGALALIVAGRYALLAI